MNGLGAAIQSRFWTKRRKTLCSTLLTCQAISTFLRPNTFAPSLSDSNDLSTIGFAKRKKRSYLSTAIARKLSPFPPLLRNATSSSAGLHGLQSASGRTECHTISRMLARCDRHLDVARMKMRRRWREESCIRPDSLLPHQVWGWRLIPNKQFNLHTSSH